MHESDQTSTGPAQRPYQVVLFVGAPDEQAPDVPGVRVVDLTVDSAAASSPVPVAASDEAAADHPVLAALRASGLTPADLRSKALFMVAPGTAPAVAVTTYAAAVAFAGRRLDAACGDSKVDAGSLDDSTRAVEDAGRPATTFDHVQVGASHPELPSVGATGQLSPADVTHLRYARRARMVPAPEPLGAIAQFVVVAALRARGGADRFPYLVTGEEPAELGIEVDTVGVDLDALRRAALELRRTMRFEDRSSLAEKVEPSLRQRTLLSAAALPVEAVMVALGTSTPGTGLWHCPRPDRHTNGDANASMRVDKGRARCFRCDPEKVDALRLTADVRGCSFDEAASWLLAEVEPRLAHFEQLAAAMMPAADDSTEGADSAQTEPAGV